jgi:preprotein translocase subunit SecB
MRPKTYIGDEKISINIQVLVDDKEYPESSDVHMKLSTPEDSLLIMNIILLARYRYIGNDAETDRGKIHQYTREKAIYFLLPYITQMVSLITSKMGMNPVNIMPPQSIELIPLAPRTEK